MLCGHCGSETQGVPAIPQQAEFGPYAESISWQQLCLLHGAKGVTAGKGRMREQQSLFSSVFKECYLSMDFKVIQNSMGKTVIWNQL